MSNEQNADCANWYTLYTKPRQEERADSNLRAWGIETFTPWVRERRYSPYSGGVIYTQRALFTRYIFARFDPSLMLHKISYTRGVQSVVSFGEAPAPLGDEIISLIKLRVGDDGFVRFDDDLKAGDRVVIKDGALKNFTGIFERTVKDTDRVRILLTTINYQSHVIVERDMIRLEKPAYAQRRAS